MRCAYEEFGIVPSGGEFSDLVLPASHASSHSWSWQVVLAADGVRVVGSCALGPCLLSGSRPEVHLHRLYLGPSVRGRGLASCLLSDAAELASAAGAEALVAASDSRLDAAASRYLSCGFLLAPFDPSLTFRRYELLLSRPSAGSA